MAKQARKIWKKYTSIMNGIMNNFYYIIKEFHAQNQLFERVVINTLKEYYDIIGAFTDMIIVI